MSAKIRAAVSARRDPDFVIVARTDAAGVEGFDAAVRRARDYLAAGADMIFPEALESADQFARFAREVKAPLLANMTEFGRSPLIPFDDLAAMGYTAAIYPLTALRAAMNAAEGSARNPARARIPAEACSTGCRLEPSSTTCSTTASGNHAIKLAERRRPIDLAKSSDTLGHYLAPSPARGFYPGDRSRSLSRTWRELAGCSRIQTKNDVGSRERAILEVIPRGEPKRS